MCKLFDYAMIFITIGALYVLDNAVLVIKHAVENEPIVVVDVVVIPVVFTPVAAPNPVVEL